ncbi:MAG: hypothetical protein K8R69_00465 [Deltaproteobacteria bacterium]|nr:hypothetical protein [Deltaproteobacteria bacterium]
MTASIDNPKIAAEILNSYSEHDAVFGKGEAYSQRPKFLVVQSSERQKDLGLTDAQRDALNRAMEDGIVDGSERKALSAAGFGDKFIQAVAGENGQAALKKRILWLSHHSSSNASNALELRLSSQRVDGLTPEESETLNDGLEEIDEAVQDLIKIARDGDSPQERFDALQKLAVFSATEAGKRDPALEAILAALEDPKLVLERPQILRLLGDLPASAFEPVLGKLVQALQDSNGLVQQEALSALNRVFLRAIDAQMSSGFGDVLWAMQKVEAFAKDPRQNAHLKDLALIVLANSGRASVVPRLSRMVEWGSSPEVISWSRRTVEETVGACPELSQFRDIASYESARQAWVAKRDEAQVRIENAKALVANAEEAKAALLRCQEQMDARYRCNRGGLQMYPRAKELPLLSETAMEKQSLAAALEDDPISGN